MSQSATIALRDVDRISTFMQALAWIQRLGINVADQNNLTIDTAKAIIRSHIESKQGEAPRSKPPGIDTTSAAMKEDTAHRKRLALFYKDTRKYIEELPAPFQNDLDSMFPQYQQKMTNMTVDLGLTQCLLLVAGETGSGKSSLVNLLLGHELLPTSDLRCTAVVVEISYGEKPEAVLHWKDDSSGKSSQPIKMSCESLSKSSSMLAELERKITERDPYTDESPYEKIELFWPIEMLKGGLVIVDSPGVGESRLLPIQLAAYMERACGFIYVLDSTSAIHQHRLGQLLLKAVETSDGFDPSTTMFICNKWDNVQKDDHDRVKVAMHERLSLILPEVKKSQLFPISVRKCRNQLEYGQILQEHQKLIDSLRRFVPEALRGRLRRFYRFLSTILKRSLYTLRMSYNLNRQKVEDIRRHTGTVEQRMEKIKTAATKSLEEMRNDVKRSAWEAGNEIVKDMNAMKTRVQLLAWYEDDWPKKEKSWQSVMKNAYMKISERISKEIDQWEDKHKQVTSLQDNILQKFKKSFEVLDNQLKDIEKLLTHDMTGSSVGMYAFPQAMKENFNSKRQDRISKQSTKGGPAHMSMGYAVTSGLSFDPKDPTLKSLFKEFNHDPSKVMASATEIFLGYLDEVTVVSALTKFFDRFVKGLDNVAAFLPELISADRELLRKLNSDLQSGERRLDVFPSMSRAAADLQGGLDMFFVQRLMVTDFTVDSLVYDERNALGRGTFANVYKGTFRNKVVAIKEPKDRIKISDVTDVLIEESMLREINHVNVVKYFGVCRKGRDDDVRLIIVMEFCPDTLKGKFIDRATGPSNHGNEPEVQNRSIQELLNLLIQICRGLAYLHNKKIVHRDLKPDNVLLTETCEVRIADLGLAKKVKDIATLGIGTPVYMAPEILLLLEKYDTQADIYSLAMIMWELWYGRDLAEYASAEIVGGLRTNIRTGWRPSCTLRHPPLPFWKELMMTCWEEEPAKRKTALEVGKTLSKNLMEFRSSTNL